MSAFIVSHDHIDAIVTWAACNGVSVWDAASGRRHDVKGNEQAIGLCLLYENYRSVAYRYGESLDQDYLDRYRWRVFTAPLSAVQALKAVDCLVYQSCEHDEWDASMAYRILTEIRHAAWRKVPGYESADYCIKRDQAVDSGTAVPLTALMN